MVVTRPSSSSLLRSVLSGRAARDAARDTDAMTAHEHDASVVEVKLLLPSGANADADAARARAGARIPGELEGVVFDFDVAAGFAAATCEKIKKIGGDPRPPPSDDARNRRSSTASDASQASASDLAFDDAPLPNGGGADDDCWDALLSAFESHVRGGGDGDGDGDADGASATAMEFDVDDASIYCGSSFQAAASALHPPRDVGLGYDNAHAADVFADIFDDARDAFGSPGGGGGARGDFHDALFSTWPATDNATNDSIDNIMMYPNSTTHHTNNATNATVTNALTNDAVATHASSGAFYLTLVPIRPRPRGERRSLRTFPGASLRLPLAFNPRPRRLSTPSDAFQLHPDLALYGTTLSAAKSRLRRLRRRRRRKARRRARSKEQERGEKGTTTTTTTTTTHLP